MKQETRYPAILKRYEENDQTYFVITSPNVQGMVVEANTKKEAIREAESDLLDWFKVKGEVAEVMDTSNWQLKDNEELIYLSVNLANLK